MDFQVQCMSCDFTKNVRLNANSVIALSVDSVMHCSQVDAKELSKLIKLTFDNTLVADIQNEVIPVLIDNYGGVDGVLKTLKVVKDVGVPDVEVDARKKIFGENKVEQEPQDSLLKLMWEALQDPTLIFLTCAAIFSLFIGVFIEQRPLGWLEGAAILFAVLVVVTVGAVNDYQKEKQFRELNAKRDDVQIMVLRGGKSLKTSTFDLVVGDLILLSTGSRAIQTLFFPSKQYHKYI
jgi:magnesium-transporting ATPase (P-type)